MKKSKIPGVLTLQALLLFIIPLFTRVFAEGEVIAFTSLDNLLWSVIKTIQYYTLPIMTIALVFLGIKLVASGDDTATKDLVKNWMIKTLIGGVLIFGAAVIAGLIKTAVGG